MNTKKELQVAYALAIVFLVIGILSYAAFPAKAPAQPVRLVYQNAAGNVLFDHDAHLSDSAYGLSCGDCHHHPADDNGLIACGKCHGPEGGTAAVAETCNGCHDPADYEGAEVLKRTDAFHTQCETCHKDYGVGPQEDSARCRLCHAM